MRKRLLLFLTAVSLISLSSCNDKNDEFDDKGSSSVTSLTAPETAYMGDSITFNFKVSSEGIRLNQSKAQLLFGETVVSERIILTPTAGEYSGKLLIPFMKNIPDGEVTVKLRVQNERFASSTAEENIQIVRPTFPKLVLRDAEGTPHDMYPVPDQPYTYAVTDVFPSELFATIEAPKYGENGNAIVFGSADGKIANGVTDKINFSADLDGSYQVTFNTLTYEGTPFIKFAMNNIEFEKVDDTHYKVETDLTQGQDINITGLKADYPNYWINPAIFDKIAGTNGKTLRFRGRDGKYRLTVDKNLKFFKVEAMNGSALADLTKGDDVIWCIGDGNIGQPSYSKNNINWSTGDKVLCLAPLGNGLHQLILKANETIKVGNINFKFYYQRGWGTEFTADKISLGDDTTWFRVNAADGNIRGGTTPLIAGKYYVITVDMSAGPTKAKMYVEEKDSFPEVDPTPVK
ncbi:DUF5125 domain-containing protein [uncultured Bacteroides sp.]|uniref:DUF5125 domain-containing protein n=1 Tax=uncultured Bacteroides sp. TaxID=162156 RepID=UPI002AA7BAE6|nr:DUF5125 domain-containing protein [uncultured Bacteroides sp.]